MQLLKASNGYSVSKLPDMKIIICVAVGFSVSLLSAQNSVSMWEYSGALTHSLWPYTSEFMMHSLDHGFTVLVLIWVSCFSCLTLQGKPV